MLADKINSGGHKWGRRAPAAHLSGAGIRYLINSGGIITATPHSSNFESIGDQIVQNVQEQVVRGVGVFPGSFREFCAGQDGGMSPHALPGKKNWENGRKSSTVPAVPEKCNDQD